jgi:hypothetical protein
VSGLAQGQAQATAYPDVFATAAAQLFATAAAGPMGQAAPTPMPAPATPVATGVAPPDLAGLYVTLAVVAVAWAWRSGRLPVWGAARWALALPWRRDDADARRRCRWQGRDWLVRGVLPDAFWQRPALWPLVGAWKRGYLAIVAGEEGVGKSFVLTYLAVCLVLGLDWLGFPVRRLRAVVYVDLELDAQTFWQRVAAVVAGLRLADPEGAFRVCRRRLVYLNPADHGEDLAVAPPEAARKGERAPGLARIRRTVRRTGAGLALLDGLTTGGGTAPGDQEGATRQQHALQRLGCAVLAIDHLSDRDRVAGSRSKTRLGRVIYTLRARADGTRVLAFAKGNFTPRDAQVIYRSTFHPGPPGELGPVTFTLEPGGEGHGGAVVRVGEGAPAGGVRPRPPGPQEPQTPAPEPQDDPMGVAPGVGGGVGVPRGAGSRVTQGAPRKAYAPILAAVARRGPGAAVSYEALAAETGYARGTVVNRCGELARLGRLAPGPAGTVRLAEAEEA